MLSLPWIGLLFTASVGLVALYGLTVSGHFPREFRAAELATRSGTLILWATALAALLSAVIALSVAWSRLPWHAAVIGGGMAVLAAPLLLRVFSDRFVNGRRALVVFAAAAMSASVVLWLGA